MKILRLIIFIISISNCFSQNKVPVISWEKTYGGSEVEFIKSIQLLSDGGYLLGGVSGSNDGDIKSGNKGKLDFWIVKIDNRGSIIWEKTYGGSLNEYLMYILPTTDDGFLLGGNTQSNDGDVHSGNNGDLDYWVVKIDQSGNIEWEQSYGGSGVDLLKSIQPSPEGGYLLGGTTLSNNYDVQSGNSGLSDFWIVKIGNTGEIEWEKTFGKEYDEILNHHQITPDGGYILGGFKFIYPLEGGIHSDYWAVKINSRGVVEWEKSYGGSNNESIKYIQPAVDGGYLLGGITSSNDGDVQSGNKGTYPTLDFWVVKIDELGAIEWEKTFGGSDYDVLRTIHSDVDGGYLLGGTTQSKNHDVQSSTNGQFDFWIVKIDNIGRLRWERTFGGSNIEVIWSVQCTAENKYLLGGSTRSNNGDIQSGNNGFNEFWFVEIEILNVPVIHDQTFSLSANLSIGPTLIIIAAHDDDGDILTYKITSGNEEDYFLIQNDGTLELRKELENLQKNQIILTVEVTDGKFSATGTITLNIDEIFDLEELSTSIEIYPNPIVNEVLKVDIEFFQGLKLQIIDIMGHTILTKYLSIGLNQIECDGISDGVYLLRLIDESHIIHQQKIIKK